MCWVNINALSDKNAKKWTKTKFSPPHSAIVYDVRADRLSIFDIYIPVYMIKNTNLKLSFFLSSFIFIVLVLHILHEL